MSFSLLNATRDYTHHLPLPYETAQAANSTIQIAVLYGGGLDSTALVLYLIRLGLLPKLIWVDYEQANAEAECQHLEYMVETFGLDYEILMGDFSFSQSPLLTPHTTPINPKGGANPAETISYELPIRNLVLTMQAASYMLTKPFEYNALYLGYHKEPADRPFPDATPDWFTHVEKAIGSATHCKDFQLYAPFSNLSRQEIFNIGMDSDPHAMMKAPTCYHPTHHPNGFVEWRECGECPHCKQKAAMLDYYRSMKGSSQ